MHAGPAAAAFIVSSGRGVHEAIGAARRCAEAGVQVAVIDMPSIDEELLLQVCDSGKPVCLAEQNNGSILQNLLRVMHRMGCDPRASRGGQTPSRRSQTPSIFAINTLDRDGKPRFIHSGTYEELIEAFRLTAAHIAEAVMGALNERGSR